MQGAWPERKYDSESAGICSGCLSQQPLHGLCRESVSTRQDREAATEDRVAQLAETIVVNLAAPDLLVLEEVQDNTGPVDDEEIGADVTSGALISAIQTAGGPRYQYRDIPPRDDRDGGAPGGNIRVGFLFRTDRG